MIGADLGGWAGEADAFSQALDASKYQRVASLDILLNFFKGRFGVGVFGLYIRCENSRGENASFRVCHKATMPVIFALLQIGATLPVTVCTAERS